MPASTSSRRITNPGARPGDSRPVSPDEMRATAPWIFAWCAFVTRNALVVLGSVLVVAVAFTWLASRLELRTNFAELLPSKDPAVEELKRTSSKIGGTQVLQVAVEGPDREANVAFASELVARLRKLPPELVRMAACDVREEKAFFEANKWLYVDLPTLEQARDALRSRIERAKNPLLVDLLDDGEPPEVIAKRLREKAKRLDQFPTGYFEGDSGQGPGSIVAVVIRPPGGLFGERVGEDLRDATQKLVDELGPADFACRLHKGEKCAPLRVGLTGDVMAALDERAALENDLVWATSLCIALVGLAVVLFYGRFRAIPFVALPAFVGAAIAFGAAYLLFGYLNSSTAFMGSIVVGNGINFAIIQYARYEEERRHGALPAEAAPVALAATIRPTAVAALGAAAAYASLTLTRFRGFSQFGTIGGIGMIASWLATVAVLPALWARFDKRSQARRVPLPAGTGFADLVSRAATRAPRVLLGVSLALSVVAAVPLKRYLQDPFEYDFTRLRNRRTLVSGAGALAPRVDRIFGRTLTPAAILADTRAHVDEIRTKIFARDRAHAQATGTQPLIGEIRTLDDFLPGAPELQRRKLGVLSDIRALLDDPALAQLDEEDRKPLDELRPPDRLRVISDDDLPATVRQPFTETDGSAGRILLVYHDESVSVWDGRNLMRISDLIGEIPLDDGTIIRSSGHAVIFASMTRSIESDAPIATGWSLLGVALLVMVLARGRNGAALVLGTLLAGVLWMLGAAAWFGVRTNFLNFIALPITFGIGVDYGVNIYLRYRLEGRGRVGRAVRATGGAVALCSLTTIIGYGALLVADNQALRSFGEMAILGELACLIAAVLVMPAYLVWVERKGQPPREKEPDSEHSAVA